MIKNVVTNVNTPLNDKNVKVKKWFTLDYRASRTRAQSQHMLQMHKCLHPL